MATLDALLDRQVLFFGGKGGVGKTMTAAATALAASRRGRRVLLVSTDPAHNSGDVLGRPVGPEPVDIVPNLRAVEIDAARESARYVGEVKSRVATLFGPSILKEASRQIDLAASMPAAEEVALFDRIASIVADRADDTDLVIFDTAPTGHTLRLLRMPELMDGWLRALTRSRRAMLGIQQDDRTDPILVSLAERLDRLQAFKARLLSRRVTAFVLVLIAERLPIEESARALAQLDEAGIGLGALIVNRVLPSGSTDPFLQARQSQEAEYLQDIDRRFASHLQRRVPQLPRDVHGLDALETIAAALFLGGPS
jgi:arsenite-transporting ATPase